MSRSMSAVELMKIESSASILWWMPMGSGLRSPMHGWSTLPWTSSRLTENRWQREERCQDRKAYFDAPNVFRTEWFLSKKAEAIRFMVRIDARVGGGLKNFFFLSFRKRRSSGIYPPPRRYENMSLNNFRVLTFRCCASEGVKKMRRNGRPGISSKFYKCARLEVDQFEAIFSHLLI